MIRPVLILAGLAGALSACAAPPVPPAPVAVIAPVVKRPVVMAAAEPADDTPVFTGIASWYRTGRRLHRTYSGELLNNNRLTAASSDLPMGTLVRVGRVDDGDFVIVRVNDRMPRNHRLIDLSERAARELGLMGCGVATVTVTPIEVASAP